MVPRITGVEKEAATAVESMRRAAACINFDQTNSVCLEQSLVQEELSWRMVIFAHK